MSHYDKYRRNAHSQWGEDGILEQILRELGIESGYFVDVGASLKFGHSNTLLWAEKGWSGVWIDKDASVDEGLGKLLPEARARVTVAQQEITPERTVDVVLDAIGAPQEFALLSIDIESATYHAWATLTKHVAAVAVLEIAGAYRPGQRIADKQQGEWREDMRHASWTDMVELADRKGYSTVAYAGNVIVVLKSLVPKLSMPPAHLQNPDLLWSDEWWGEGPPFTEVGRP